MFEQLSIIVKVEKAVAHRCWSLIGLIYFDKKSQNSKFIAYRHLKKKNYNIISDK